MGLPESISSWNLIYLSLGFLWKISLIVFRVWPFLWCWLSFIYSSMLVISVVVSIYTIIVYLELVLLKIWRELVAFMWRVMGGAILQLIVLSVFLIALRCRNICLVSVDTTVWSFWNLLNRTWLYCPWICIKYLCFMRIYIGGWLVLERCWFWLGF